MTLSFTSAPTLPALSSPSTFNDRSLALFSWLVNTYITELEAVDGFYVQGQDVNVDNDTWVVDVSANAVGVGIALPDGLLHVHTATAGAVSADTTANELVLESANATGMSLLGGSSNNLTIAFGDSGDANIGQIIYNNPNDRMVFHTNAADRLRIESDGTINPAADNGQDMGSGSLRFTNIYATNATIQTSDRNEKQDIAGLTIAEKKVARRLKNLVVTYRWKSSVAAKGAAARTHVGLIAQDVQDAFTAEGLDATKYSMFIKAPIMKTVKKTKTVSTQKVQTVSVAVDQIDVANGKATKTKVQRDVAKKMYNTLPMFDEAGERVGEHREPIMEDVLIEYEVDEPDGFRLGLRYPELLAFILAA